MGIMSEEDFYRLPITVANYLLSTCILRDDAAGVRGLIEDAGVRVRREHIVMAFNRVFDEAKSLKSGTEIQIKLLNPDTRVGQILRAVVGRAAEDEATNGVMGSIIEDYDRGIPNQGPLMGAMWTGVKGIVSQARTKISVSGRPPSAGQGGSLETHRIA